MRIQRSLPADASAPGRARAGLDPLAPEIPPPARDDLRLMVSELVTNAVKYGDLRGHERIDLDVWVAPTRTEVMVRYPQHARFDPVAPPVPRGEEGWGLYVVDQLADRWSVVECGGQLLAWVEVDQDRASRQPRRRAS